MNKKGFTLIELLLVVMIIGFMLAVILPRGLRATTDAKYNIVRQNAAELGAYGNDWVEQQILAQDADSTATRAAYLHTLVKTFPPANPAAWIADNGPSNWNISSAGGVYLRVPGRNMTGAVPPTFAFPENSVEEIIDPAKMLRNPFNGASVFSPANRPISFGVGRPIPGTIACARAVDSSTGGSFYYYAFIFQGTDSTKSHVDPNRADFHGGMGDPGGGLFTLGNIREGVFFTKVRR